MIACREIEEQDICVREEVDNKKDIQKVVLVAVVAAESLTTNKFCFGCLGFYGLVDAECVCVCVHVCVCYTIGKYGSRCIA